MKPLRDCRLYTFVDTAYLHGREPADVARQLCDGDSDLVQLRAKGASLEEVRRIAQTLLPITGKSGAWLVINDYPQVARDVGAPMVHLGQEDFFDAGHTQAAQVTGAGRELAGLPLLPRREERAGERRESLTLIQSGPCPGTSSPHPSPPSDGGEGARRAGEEAPSVPGRTARTSSGEISPRPSPPLGAGARESEARQRLLLGLSTHSPDQAERALRAGPDYLAIGPVFATPTKPGRPAVTIDYVRWAAKHVGIPWFAIGGITLRNLDEVLAAGATRICVVSAILNAPDIAKACREFKDRLPSAPRKS